MKTYTHHSGKYNATKTMYGGYEIVLLAGNGTDINRVISSVPAICKDFIEDSKDWIEVTSSNYYSRNSIQWAFRDFLDDFLVNGEKLTYKRRYEFEHILLAHLENHKKAQ